jgi:predicted membrane-bound spermidine synthase
MTDTHRGGRRLLYLLFAVSGLSGLLYESVWSHYLKLFLGHAAYAQTLVLAIFMGGMAIGAWVPSRYGSHWKNLLARYAVIEVFVGVCGLVFHKLFVAVTDLAYDSVIPALGSAWSVNLFKWSLAALLILPQSVLLGMTFPLMSAGLIRRYPHHPGASIAMLYFTNSLGAAVGVLVSGFVLIELVGLPGTILTAGLINIVLGLGVWLLARSTPEPPAPRSESTAARASEPSTWRLLIMASFLTGAASFIYEIGWIRMLSLVLGASTHAFELMLSAFIIGLAFGGLWIYRRIDQLAQPVRFLGWVQVVMGVLALATLVAYNGSFDVMQMIMRSLTSTDGGYRLFNLASHAIAVAVMVPVTFCAGMTLPLLTHTLLSRGHGERSIGAVYAANTLGAIAGVFFAIHIGLPALGLKGLISIGATIDIGLGIILLTAVARTRGWRPALAASMLAVIALATALFGIQLDRYKMASGLYRYDEILSPATVEIAYHKDGKTATVDLLKYADGSVSILTNGKSDAAIQVSESRIPTADEPTMILVAAIPLALLPNARTAANIGMGSGLTTHVMLDGTHLEKVDTIEIEPAVIEAAQGFRPRVEAAYTDPRSRFHIDDAKTFLSAHNARYDIITSEPSNPWVSGVATLFSDEFYRRTRTHLNPGGILVQWIHLYESDIDLVSTVIKAISHNFSDYALYAPNTSDLLIVAVKDGKLPKIDERVLAQPQLARALKRIDVHTLQDLELRRIGDRSLLDPLFVTAPIPMNSDYFPVLDLRAVRARFLKSNATDLISLRIAKLPALQMLGRESTAPTKTRPTPARDSAHSRLAHTAMVLRDFYTHDRLRTGDSLEPNLMRHVLLAQRLAGDCSVGPAPSLWLDSVSNVMDTLSPYLAPAESLTIWRRFRGADCYRRLSPPEQEVFALYGAIAQRDATTMAALAEKLLAHTGMSRESNRYLLSAGMLGYLADDKPQRARQLWNTHADRVLGADAPDLMLRFLLAHSLRNAGRALQ